MTDHTPSFTHHIPLPARQARGNIYVKQAKFLPIHFSIVTLPLLGVCRLIQRICSENLPAVLY